MRPPEQSFIFNLWNKWGKATTTTIIIGLIISSICYIVNSTINTSKEVALIEQANINETKSIQENKGNIKDLNTSIESIKLDCVKINCKLEQLEEE